MKKSELIEEIKKQLGENQSKINAEKALNAVIESIKVGIKKDEIVQLVGFGTFKKVYRSARTGINPKTKEPIEIKPSQSVHFKASPNLKTIF